MDYPVVTADLAAIVAPMAAMSANSYRTVAGQPFDLSCSGWVRIDLDGNVTTKPAKASWLTGLVVDLYRDRFGRVAVVFRGTDNLPDWILGNISFPLSVHYKSAYKFYRAVHDRFGSSIEFVAGHSLGGGIALGVSLRYGVDAYVFNPSPRVFDGLGDHHLSAKRVAIFQEGDPLQKRWSYSTKFNSLLSEEKVNVFKVSYQLDGASPHSIDALAGNLIRSGGARNLNLSCMLRP